MKSLFAFATAAVICLGSSQASGQIDQSALLSATSVSTTTSNYYFAKPNELTIIVNVLGFVQKPGRYEISSSIDLINLISLAGGPNADGTLSDVKVTRLVRTESRIDRKEFRVDLDDLPKVKQPDLALQPGDVIEISRSGWSVVRDVFGVVGYAALITSTAATVISLSR